MYINRHSVLHVVKLAVYIAIFSHLLC